MTYTAQTIKTALAPTKEKDISSTEYQEFIRKYTTDYTTDNYFVHVGKPSVNQGWILHATVVQTQMEQLLRDIIPVLTRFSIQYKVIRNRNLLVDMNGGKLGYFKIGKAITVFFDDEEKVVPLLEILIPLTSNYVGPQIFSDYKLANILYIRYGSFTPIIAKDSLGNNVSLMRDLDGRVVVDEYKYPPSLPAEVSNPFIPLMDKIERPSEGKFIGKKFFPVKLLKADTKGNVWKGIYFSKFLIPKWCVIKQGRKGMFPDDAGRDARNRIQWQFKANAVLKNDIPAARILNYFEDEGQAYLVMEYIKGGTDVMKALFDEMENKPWFLQSDKVRKEILDTFLSIVSAVNAIHARGYIHRDITGTNFLQDHKGEIRLIDLELIYSTNDQEPDPPFGLGTHGFMSPEQESRGIPSPKDDSYSIGALLLMTLSGGMVPTHVVTGEKVETTRKVAFLVRDIVLEKLILQCLDTDPTVRPSIAEVASSLNNYKNILSDSIVPKGDQRDFYQVDNNQVRLTIQRAINALSGKKLSHNQLWHSGVENGYGPELYPIRKRHVFAGLYRGVSGPMWLLSKLNKIGYDISLADVNLNKALQFIESEIVPAFENVDPSFYYGKAGISVMLSAAIDGGIIPKSGPILSYIERGFDQDALSYDILHGMAGQGLAMLQAYGNLNQALADSKLAHYANKLLAAQNKDGSWSFSTIHHLKPEKKTGFGYGSAGISYFLLVYGSKFSNSQSLDAGLRGIEYLTQIKQRAKKGYEWSNSDHDKRVCTWWCNGAPGIMLAYLKAFQIFQDPKYLTIVNDCLSAVPKHLVYQDLSQCHGLSGMGEIYLEAHRITKNQEWMDRASWIVNTINCLRQSNGEKEDYWMVEKQDFPTADFMIGNTGVIHFLARYEHPEKLSFPFLIN